jgi:uncharacterized protein (TIGR02246 family)
MMNTASIARNYRTLNYCVQPLVLLICFTSSVSFFAERGDTASADVSALIQHFIKAQQSFDPVALKNDTIENYCEVSPLGEVDKRDAVLEFYNPVHRVDVPSALISNENLRILNDAAIDIVTIKYTVAEAGKSSHGVSMRATFVAVRQQGVWKLASAHYTPIRPHATQR